MTETEDVTSTGDADTKAHEAVIDEALRLIDSGLSELMHRELVSTDEVSDLLLDVRMLLTAAELATESGVAGRDPSAPSSSPSPSASASGCPPAGGPASAARIEQRVELGRDRGRAAAPGRRRRRASQLSPMSRWPS